MKAATKLACVVIFQLMGACLVMGYVSTLKTDGYKRQYELGFERGKVELYSEIESNGGVIPEAVSRPFVEKHLMLNLGEGGNELLYLTPASICFIVSFIFAISAAVKPSGCALSES